MAYPQVTVTLKGSRAEFRSHGPESDSFAEYLSKMFDQSNNPGAAKAVLLAKARAGDALLEVNRLKAEKAQALRDQGQSWLAKSRETNLSGEVRSFLESKARAALKAADEIQAELSGQKA
jgi:hypothetical protein